MVPQVEGITLFYNKAIALQSIEAINHTESLSITNYGHIGIILFNQSDGTRMVRFHVVHYQVVDRLVTQDSLNLLYKYFKKANLNGIHQRHLVVVNEV